MLLAGAHRPLAHLGQVTRATIGNALAEKGLSARPLRAGLSAEQRATLHQLVLNAFDTAD